MDTGIDRMAAEVMACVQRMLAFVPEEWTPVSVPLRRAGIKTYPRMRMAVDVLHEMPQVELARVTNGHMVRAARSAPSRSQTKSSSPQPSPTGACGTRPSETPGGSEGSKPSN